MHLDPQIAVVLTALATLVSALFVGFGIWKDKKRQSKLDQVAAYKDIVDVLQADMRTMKQDIRDLNDEVDDWKAKYASLLEKYNASVVKIKSLERRLKKYENGN